MLNDMSIYTTAFSHLHVKVMDGRRFPNKAILLISVMELIRCGYILTNKIYLDNTIRIAFEYNWRLFINTLPPSIWTPFWHMKKEFFWHFQPVHTLDDVEKLSGPGETATIGKMKSEIEYAYLDKDLFILMQSSNGRSELFNILKTTYLL